MASVNSARNHQLGSVSTTSPSRHHESRRKPASTCTHPSTSGKSVAHYYPWLVRPATTSPNNTADSSASRRQKRSGSQSGLDLLKKIVPPAEDVFDHSPTVKSGGQSDVAAKEERPKRALPRLRLIFTTPSSSSTTPDSKTRAELSPKTSEVPTSNLAVVTSARESGVTNSSKSTKREREEEDKDEDQSRAEAKRARKETSTSGRKGILKDPKEELPSNPKRSVRWAEQLEDYNYPDYELSETDLSDLDSEMEDYDDDDDDDVIAVDDAFPDNVHAHAYTIPSYYGSVSSSDEHNQQFFAAVPPLAVPALPNNWFNGFIASLSSEDVRDLRVAYDTFYQPAMAPVQIPHPRTSTSGSYSQAPTGVWDYVRGADGISRAVFIPNHQHHWQEVPDLSASPDPSDQSLTPPSPAHDGVNKSPDESVNVVITDDECSEGGLSAEGPLFPGGPNTAGQPFGDRANLESSLPPRRSSLDDGDCGEGKSSSGSEECSANGCDMENKYRTAARRQIDFSASMETVVKAGGDDRMEKFAGSKGASGSTSSLT